MTFIWEVIISIGQENRSQTHLWKKVLCLKTNASHLDHSVFSQISLKIFGRVSSRGAPQGANFPPTKRKQSIQAYLNQFLKWWLEMVGIGLFFDSFSSVLFVLGGFKGCDSPMTRLTWNVLFSKPSTLFFWPFCSCLYSFLFCSSNYYLLLQSNRPKCNYL